MALLCAVPAHATGGIACSSPDDVASVEITVGRVPGMAVVGARIDVGDRYWAMSETGDKALTVSQAFATGGHYWIDFTDEIVNRVVAELRLHRVDEGDDTGFGGTMRMPDFGAWTLICFEG
ncbi:hypothetical protein [Mesorhizobium sp. Z1-4]|uniref:hypothetical protein n=1 Tax=Mesorhizobium sp. Z1-4 TaxID=2448478 RepID=UPI000FDC3546|nr:hypothetical protein [Mesorhizobium sp. Z1-4]